MDQSLGYLRESLSNYLEREIAQTIYSKLKKPYGDAHEFADHLSQEEIQYLNDILPKEIDYAKNEKDQKRQSELTNVFEQLY